MPLYDVKDKETNKHVFAINIFVRLEICTPSEMFLFNNLLIIIVKEILHFLNKNKNSLKLVSFTVNQE